jgi:hypothetical protein
VRGDLEGWAAKLVLGSHWKEEEGNLKKDFWDSLLRKGRRVPRWNYEEEEGNEGGCIKRLWVERLESSRVPSSTCSSHQLFCWVLNLSF